ncbi:MAG: hypothetical protein JWP57_2046 [Spirosoma sp.]|nr:hypothetical protein [Spirosoma sp.]
MKKKEWLTDRDEGVRTIVQIRNLPVKELTDTEICKLFFDRFEATALVMLYEDKDGVRHCFGRLKTRKQIIANYRRLSRWIHGVTNNLLGFHNIRSIESDDSQS